MFISAKSPKGNIGHSQISQQDADQQAVNMDTNNCYGCRNCPGCHDCRNCHSCHDCHNCHDCHGCHNCSDCHNCHDCYNCHDCHNCHDCSNCHDCHDCSDCSDCHNCHNCYNCSDSVGALRWRGAPATNLLALNGLTWPVAISSKQIQIGCQCHTIEAWQQFSDARITKMDEKRALQFWNKYKSLILMLADTQKTS